MRQKGGINNKDAEVYGIIRYSRLLDREKGADVLREALAEDGLKENPFLELELTRASLLNWGPEKSVAEVWLLLNRHPYEETLWRWGAWYFDRQRKYDETAHLIKLAASRDFQGSWIALHRSLIALRAGKMREADDIINGIIAGTEKPGPDSWVLYASLGLIQERRRSLKTALERFETAAALKPPLPDASSLALHLSRCLSALGRREEARDVLVKALSADNDNINLRHELDALTIAEGL
jgi:tetratricopeptide (TPR) repeat protein